jgi:hypothetical protein
MHKQSEKFWLAHLAEDQRYAAMDRHSRAR